MSDSFFKVIEIGDKFDDKTRDKIDDKLDDNFGVRQDQRQDPRQDRRQDQRQDRRQGQRHLLYSLPLQRKPQKRCRGRKAAANDRHLCSGNE